MGIDFLDTMFRLEKRFDVKLNVQEFWDAEMSPGQMDIRVDDHFQWVMMEIEKQGGKVPDDAWEQYREVLAEVLFLSPDEIRSDRLMYKELGME